MQFFTIFFLSALLVLAAVAAEEEKPWWLNQEFIDAVTFERNSGNEVIETAKAYGPFSLVAIRPGSPIHLQPINAHEYGFWIGKPTTSKCTLETKSYCPKGDKTLLELIQYSKTDTKLYMSTAPDFIYGQKVYYRDAYGALEYGPVDDENFTTPGDSKEDFKYILGTDHNTLEIDSEPFVDDEPKLAILACPSGKRRKGPWKVFANVTTLKDSDVPGGKKCNCLPIEIYTYNSTEEYGAYVYN